MLFTRSCNAFRSAGILCWEGLFVDSYNSVRVGLESGWLALILRRNDELAREWLTLVPNDASDSDIEKKYRNSFGSLRWIREEVSIDDADLKHRTNIYQILSTRSHANPASTFYVADSGEKANDLCLYPPRQLDSDAHRYKFLTGINYCLEYILWDIQARCGENFEVYWRYDEKSMFTIAGVANPDGDDSFVVVPEKVNATYQAMVLLKFADIQDNNDNNA